jgi:molybdate transport system substrate-binding protein
MNRLLILSAISLLAFTTGATSAELKIFASRAIWTVLQEVGPTFERTTGHKLNVTTGLSPVFEKRINAGEPFDLMFAPPASLDAIIKVGKLDPDTRAVLVSSDAGVGVRAGASKPDISTVEAFKQTLLKAKSITYLGVPGVPQMLERIGIANAIKSKAVILKDDDIGSELVAKGEIELVIVVITQILTTPGVDLVGPLPPEVRVTTSFGGAVSASSKAPDAARDLIKFLKSAETVKVIRAQGMTPLF